MADYEISEHGGEESKVGKTAKAISSGGIGVSLVCLSGLTLVGAVILLVTATPILVLCSPVLVPAAIVTFLFIAGFVFTGGCGVTALATLFWGYKYATGKHPMGADKLDNTIQGITNKAMQMKNRSKMYGTHGQYFFY